MSELKRFLKAYPWSLRLLQADWEQHGKTLQFLEKTCYDERMRSSEKDLEGLIKDPEVVAMVLLKGKELIGYIAGAQLESASSSFDSSTDPKIGWGEFNTFYVDNVCIFPQHRAPENFSFLVSEYVRLGSYSGYIRVTTHARKSNGLSAYCIRKLKFRRLRTIENWYDCGEDFDYLELSKERAGLSNKSKLWHDTVNQFRNAFQGTLLERIFRR